MLLNQTETHFEPTTCKNTRANNRGVTLIEIAIVLVILGLLVAGIISAQQLLQALIDPGQDGFHLSQSSMNAGTRRRPS